MMATAFLGYGISPKWSKLNLYFLFHILIVNNVHSIFYLFSFLFLINLIIFYLDDFKLSSVYSIKCFQIFSFVGLLFILIILILNLTNIIDITCSLEDKDINLHGHMSIEKEAAKYIGQGLNTIGSQLGLGATIAGVSSAVAKGIAKSGMPLCLQYKKQVLY
jgi:energy-coupling factor transporter transmembrane protein EcfT